MNSSEEMNITNRTCYYVDDIIKIKDFDFDNIFFNENTIIRKYFGSYKTLNAAKPLQIRFVKVDGFTKTFVRTKNSVLFGLEECDAIYNRIRYLINKKVVLYN